jgi:hypothetical protein
MLFGHVGFGAMGGDPNRLHATLVREPQVIDGPDPGNEERRDTRLLHPRDDRSQIVLVAVRGKSIVH